MKSFFILIVAFGLSTPLFASEDSMDAGDIEVNFTVNAPISRTWKAWTFNVDLEQWLTVKAIVEPRIGGPYELFWQPETPTQNSTLGCKVLGVVDQRLLAIEWRGPTEFSDIMNTSPFPTWVVVTLEETSTNGTSIHFRHSGWGQGKHWQDARRWQAQSWSGAFETLRAYLSK